MQITIRILGNKKSRLFWRVWPLWLCSRRLRCYSWLSTQTLLLLTAAEVQVPRWCKKMFPSTANGLLRSTATLTHRSPQDWIHHPPDVQRRFFVARVNAFQIDPRPFKQARSAKAQRRKPSPTGQDSTRRGPRYSSSQGAPIAQTNWTRCQANSPRKRQEGCGLKWTGEPPRLHQCLIPGRWDRGNRSGTNRKSCQSTAVLTSVSQVNPIKRTSRSVSRKHAFRRKNNLITNKKCRPMRPLRPILADGLFKTLPRPQRCARHIVRSVSSVLVKRPVGKDKVEGRRIGRTSCWL